MESKDYSRVPKALKYQELVPACSVSTHGGMEDFHIKQLKAVHRGAQSAEGITDSGHWEN